MSTPPKTLYETASYELNQFRERRVADRRAVPRDTPDRRASASQRQSPAASQIPQGTQEPRQKADEAQQ